MNPAEVKSILMDTVIISPSDLPGVLRSALSPEQRASVARSYHRCLWIVPTLHIPLELTHCDYLSVEFRCDEDIFIVFSGYDGRDFPAMIFRGIKDVLNVLETPIQ